VIDLAWQILSIYGKANFLPKTPKNVTLKVVKIDQENSAFIVVNLVSIISDQRTSIQTGKFVKGNFRLSTIL